MTAGGTVGRGSCLETNSVVFIKTPQNLDYLGFSDFASRNVHNEKKLNHE